MQRYGELLTGKPLYRMLGFASGETFRVANKRGNVPLPIFQLANRRGYFALTRDVAAWLKGQRDDAVEARKRATQAARETPFPEEDSA